MVVRLRLRLILQLDKLLAQPRATACAVVAIHDGLRWPCAARRCTLVDVLRERFVQNQRITLGVLGRRSFYRFLRLLRYYWALSIIVMRYS